MTQQRDSSDMKKRNKYRISVSPSNFRVKDHGGVKSKPLPVLFKKPIQVTIITRVEGAKIYYTLDGPEPSEASTPFTKPFTLSKTTRIKARVFKNGMNPSQVFSSAYVFE